MNKKVLVALSIGFIIGVLTGVSRIEDLSIIGVEYVMFLLYSLVLIGSIVFINESIERKGWNILSFPLIALMMYIPVNVLSGVYYNGEIRYYNSFPRFYMIGYYGLFLLILYAFSSMINAMSEYKYPKVVFTITDVVSLLAIPLLVIATYFVSPH